MATLELYGSPHCPFTQELRDWLEWTRREFVEYDVEADPDANARMSALNGGGRSVPVLVEDGSVVQVGWQGRSCIVGALDCGSPLATPQEHESRPFL
jgi:glutaredoxin 3